MSKPDKILGVRSRAVTVSLTESDEEALEQFRRRNDPPLSRSTAALTLMRQGLRVSRMLAARTPAAAGPPPPER